MSILCYRGNPRPSPEYANGFQNLRGKNRLATQGISNGKSGASTPNCNLQNQLQLQEHRHNQELTIALCGVNINTRNIGVLSQHLGNPLGCPQHLANSNESINSRLPSTFHSEAGYEQNQDPLDPTRGLQQGTTQEKEFLCQKQIKQVSRKMQQHLIISSQVSLMACKFLFILSSYVAIFTWQISSSFWTIYKFSIRMQQIYNILGIDQRIKFSVFL
jgi:hypothetical protein